MLRLILSFSLVAGLLAGGARAEAPATPATPAVVAGSPGAAADRAQPLRRAVALLDYVAGDYGRAIGPDGEVLSQSEHEEQVGFVDDAARELRADAGEAGEPLAKKLEALSRAVAGRAPPSLVIPRARALREEIASTFKVVLLPMRPPDLAHGAQVYVQACAACHGADGHPNLALELPTKLPDFAVAAEMEKLTPQRIFSAATYGVPKTAMPAYDTSLSDAERWDLAFYVLSLTHPGEAGRGQELARAALVPTHYQELATLSDDEVRKKLVAAGLGPAEQEEALAGLRRGPFKELALAAKPQGLAEARRALRRAVELARAGNAAQARRDLISAYLDHFEPHEAALRARDSGLVAEIEGAFLAVRAAAPAAGPALDSSAARLDALLERADSHGPGGGLVAFIAALAIALREGVEAALLVAAMLALLRKAGRERDARAVHLGWASALVAGAFTWWASGRLLLQLSGAHRELAEGLLQLFIAALAIALREGVEAALLVAAMLALLRKAGRERDARAVHLGWASALVAGAFTWWASGRLLLQLSGAHRELAEGLLQLFTAALLLYASHWLLASLSAKRLVSFLSVRTLSAGSAQVILGLTFVAVYREMFETVLFFRGLLLESPGSGPAVASGALAGLLSLGGLVALFQKVGRKLKPRPLLVTCGVLLCALAVLMVGNGVRSLQVLGTLPLTVWGAFQLPALGLYATREGLLAQALVLFGLIVSALWTMSKGDGPPRPKLTAPA